MSSLLSRTDREDALSLGVPLEDILSVELLWPFCLEAKSAPLVPEFLSWVFFHLFHRLRQGILFSDLDHLDWEAELWLPAENPKTHRIRNLLEQAKTGLAYSDLCVAGAKKNHLVPLILIHGRFLYLRSSYLLEDEFWQTLQQSSIFEKGIGSLGLSENQLTDHYAQLNTLTGNVTKELAQAIQTIHNKNLLILTGGPGTGKTWTLSVLLYSLILKSRAIHPDRPLSIILAAPTGRAQSRMMESVHQAYQKLLLEDPLPEIPHHGLTLHKLLHHYPDNLENTKISPIFADVVAIDESSMMDLRLFKKLINAIPPHCKVILLGDPNQLPSVELGAAFADMLSTLKTKSSHFLAPYTVTLTKSWRMADHTIFDLAQAALEGLADLFYQYQIPLSEDTAFYRDYEHPVQFSSLENIIPKRLLLWLKGLYQIQKDPTLYAFIEKPHAQMAASEQKRLADLFKIFESTCVLSARRDNHPLSVDQINQALQRDQSSNNFFAGMPIMVQQNLEEHGLSNGERGLIIEVENQLFCCFRSTVEESGWKVIPLSLLQDHLQPSYAMTIHKSQGSEFEHVCIILPDHSEVLMNRSLLFTAITRAKKYVTLFANPQILEQSLACKNISTSCLGYRCMNEFPQKKATQMQQPSLFD